jgi:hypothetical protein
MTREDVATSVDIWPDNARAYNLFHGLSTQWRIGGMGGPVGLDFLVAYRRMDRMNLSPEEYDHLDNDLQIMEREALRVIGEQLEERTSRK